jgi:sulfate permease, SulP family
LPTLLGVPNEKGHLLARLFHVLGQVGEANPYTLALGAGVLIVTIGAARISSRIPGALIGLVGAGLAVALFPMASASLARCQRPYLASLCRPCLAWTT